MRVLFFIILFFMVSTGMSQNFTSHIIDDSVGIVLTDVLDMDGDMDKDVIFYKHLYSGVEGVTT